ncbi:hypothetical protein SEA_OBLADI_73 [Gordonia phage ObLaDi]|uniref:Uncharacterized protein n=1 Tax=Gordonia phage ObLaDi TaxID=2978487 RepID=A0A977KN59_9CAUD|nr:hypothetical protein SEA_OBLADI_73 [Gordonia phage ObLaDi]
MTTTPVADRLAAARAYIDEHGIDLAAAELEFKARHPHLSAEGVRLGLLVEIAIIIDIEAPFEVESLARRICAQSGVHPFDGPLPARHPMTLRQYQNRWRDMARDHLALGRTLGIIPAEGQ